MKSSWLSSVLEGGRRRRESRCRIQFVLPVCHVSCARVRIGSIKDTLDCRIDSLRASRTASTPCSSTKSSKDRGCSAEGLNAASTIVDRNISIVDSSLEFASSRVRITFCGN